MIIDSYGLWFILSISFAPNRKVEEKTEEKENKVEDGFSDGKRKKRSFRSQY